MRRNYFIIANLALALGFCGGMARAQNQTATRTPPAPAAPARAERNAPSTQQQQQPRETPAPRASGFDLTDYGVRIQPEPRLIVMMAALDAAGFDPTPTGQDPSAFRAQVRRDQAELDAGLRARLREFFERNKLKPEGGTPPTPAEQAARYVSLAYALGPAPGFEAPARTDDLPAGVLEVLDFAPLLREFYRKSGIEERLAAYLRAHRDEADRLRQPTTGMLRFVLSYLHTRPQTVVTERVPVQTPASKSGGKKKAQTVYTAREHERRFFIVPDLLAAPGATNFRVIADDYYVIFPEGADPGSTELRRAYLQYVIDPVVARFNRDIAGRREQIRQLLDERTKAGASVTPDIFTAVSRSLVIAAEARLNEAVQLAALSNETRGRLDKTKDASARAAIVKEMQSARTLVEDETVAQLADAYEQGAVLAFYFADQLRGIESSGFDISNYFADMIASFDAARESRRLTEAAEARSRALAARRERQAQRQARLSAAEEERSDVGGAAAAEHTALIKSLTEVEKMLQLKDYAGAETRLKSLLQQFQGEPRIFFALGQTASLWARDTTDDDLQVTRLNQALTHYRMAIERAPEESDRSLVCRAHESMGRILAFLDRPDEALKEFDTVIQATSCGESLKDAAREAKVKLGQ
ncbi:MAG TPA: hypothetical protein VGX92_04665 [Pyrinomonadaceae bacterium]|jgi:tetratricopeptide (TPR) repeat protein|nr:hypothetical protein [Pyrinomonadaceae bacterium]